MIQKILALATLCFVALSPAQANPQELTRLMEELRATTPDGTAYALHMIDKDGSFGTVMGATAPDGAPIDENSLFRIASNTKTYVAVALSSSISRAQRLSVDIISSCPYPNKHRHCSGKASSDHISPCPT